MGAAGVAAITAMKRAYFAKRGIEKADIEDLKGSEFPVQLEKTEEINQTDKK